MPNAYNSMTAFTHRPVQLEMQRGVNFKPYARVATSYIFAERNRMNLQRVTNVFAKQQGAGFIGRRLRGGSFQLLEAGRTQYDPIWQH